MGGDAASPPMWSIRRLGRRNRIPEEGWEGTSRPLPGGRSAGLAGAIEFLRRDGRGRRVPSHVVDPPAWPAQSNSWGGMGGDVASPPMWSIRRLGRRNPVLGEVSEGAVEAPSDLDGGRSPPPSLKIARRGQLRQRRRRPHTAEDGARDRRRRG